jgi:long-chain acyl-CoA synthetase
VSQPAPTPTVRSLLEAAAREHPGAVYATDESGTQVIRHADLAAAAQEVAALLRSLGSAPGDTVSIVMPNGLQTLRLLLGAMAGGWCVNPVNLLSQPEQMRYVIEHSDCRVVFAAPEWETLLRDMLQDLPRPVALVVTAPDAPALPPPQGPAPAPEGGPGEPGPQDMALMMYTSGTTGRPKGVMLTQANLAANARAIVAEHGLTAADRVLAVLPLYHINAFAVTMLAPLASGGSLVMPARFSGARFWRQAQEGGCTWINVVPTMIAYLLEGQDLPTGLRGRIRFCRSASAALPPEHLQAFEQRFGIGVVETMGLTETVAPSFSNPMDTSARKLGSVGRPSGCEARVLDERLQPVPDGTQGEIVIRGPNVMRGYYKDEAATAAAFTADGWLRTGDLGHRDADGFFFITGRIKELIIKGGENIAPREIDEALLRHPAVLEAAAVGIPDRHYGQEILACVVLRDGVACSEDDLRAHCLHTLGRYKTPREFRFLESLPRGPSGKIQRLKLTQG